jgi:hypothetical protein
MNVGVARKNSERRSRKLWRSRRIVEGELAGIVEDWEWRLGRFRVEDVGVREEEVEGVVNIRRVRRVNGHGRSVFPVPPQPQDIQKPRA